jgi:hypothetical protein
MSASDDADHIDLVASQQEEHCYSQHTGGSVGGRTSGHSHHLCTHHTWQPGWICQGVECSSREWQCGAVDTDSQLKFWWWNSTASTYSGAGAGAFGDFGASGEAFQNLDFSVLDGGDPLETIDFASFLHNADDNNNGFSFDSSMTFSEGLETAGLE